MLSKFLALKALANPSGGGGASSCNDLENKILTRATSDTLKWTAIAEEDIDPALMVGDLFYRISDARVTIGDLANGGHISISAWGVDVDFTAEECIELAPGLVMACDMFVFLGEDNIVLEGAEGEEPFVFPEAGMFTFVDCVLDGFAITINGYTGFVTEKFKSEYLPEGLQVGYENAVLLEEQSIANGGVVEMPFKISEDTTLTVYLNGEANTTTTKSVEMYSMLYVYAGNIGLVNSTLADTGEDFVVVMMGTEAHIYLKVETATMKIEGSVPKKISEDFIPYIPPDWSVENEETVGYIRNKPVIPSIVVLRGTTDSTGVRRVYKGGKVLTKDQLLELITNNPIVVTVGSQFGYPLAMSYGAVDEDFGWVKVLNSSSHTYTSAGTDTYYTAEYTPPET